MASLTRLASLASAPAKEADDRVVAVAEGLAALLWVSAGTLFGAHALTPLKRRILNRASAGLMVAAAIFLARSERSAAV